MDVKGFLQSKRPMYWRPWVYDLIALFNLFALVWSGAVIARMPYSGMRLSVDGVVREVHHHSPAAWVDVQEGDMVLEINGRPLDELESPYEGLHAGEWVIYTIARGSDMMVVSVLLDRLPLSRLLLAEEPVMLGVIFWGVSLLVWMIAANRLVSTLFFFLGQIATMMFASGGVAAFTSSPPEQDLFTISLTFLVPLVAHFYLVFPHHRWRRYYPFYLGGLYALATLFVVAYLLDAHVVHNPTIHALVSLQPVFWVAGVSAALISLFSPRSDASMRSRRLQRFLIAIMLFSALPVLVLSVLPHIVMGEPFVRYFWTMPFMGLLPLSYAYGVAVGNLHRFDRVLKDAVATTALILAYLGIFLLVSSALQALHLHNGWTHVIAGAATIFLVTCSYPRWRRRIDIWLDRFFYGHWYDYQTLIQQNSRYLSGLIEQDELAENLLRDVGAMRFMKAILFWAEDDVLSPYQQFGCSSDVGDGVSLPMDGTLARRLKRIGKPCTTNDLIHPNDVGALSQGSRWLLEKAQIQIWLPFLTRQNELLGLLALGERQSGEPLDRNDWAILNTLADQTSLAVENIHLVETLQKQLDRMHQMQDELKEAKWRLSESRERERLELAQLLHDGPIQDIYSVIYHLAIWRKVHKQEEDPDLLALEAELMAIEQRLRNFSTELRPPSLETFGITGAIRSHCSRIREENPGIIIESELASTRGLMTMKESLAFFRIYQEAIRNAVRHGQPKHIWVRLYVDEGRVVLEVKDDGRGFEPPERWVEFARQGHFGLLGISERAESIGAQLEVASSPGRGALVRVSVEVAYPGLASEPNAGADAIS